MTLFEGEQNGRYETDHLHMVLNEHIDFTEEELSDDRKYSIFVHEYVHYYQHFATLYGSQFCKMANLLFIETRAFLEDAEDVENKGDFNEDFAVNVGDVTTLVNIILGKQ